MKLDRTTKKSNKTTTIASVTAATWKGIVTLTGETYSEYFQVRLTADELRALLALVESGMQRDDAYRIVQEDAQRAWDTGVELRDLLAERDLGLDLDAIFDLGHYTRFAERIVGRLDAIPDLAPAAA